MMIIIMMVVNKERGYSGASGTYNSGLGRPIQYQVLFGGGHRTVPKYIVTQGHN